MQRLLATTSIVLLSLGVPATAADTPKRGGILTYMIPADAPPSFDGHRENTFAIMRGAKAEEAFPDFIARKGRPLA